MSVDAIQQVIEAEQKAEMLLQETTALIEKTAGEIATLQQVSPEIRRKAINLILEAVVN